MKEELEKLDEKGFVFTGADGKPYLCRMWGDSPWFFYWNPYWVSLKMVTQTEVWQANEQRMTDEQAKHYMDLQEKSYDL